MYSNLRNVLFVASVIGLLLLPLPAFALNFSSSAEFDWSGLTISGIGVSTSAIFQSTDANVADSSGGFNSAGTFSRDWDSAFTNLTLSSIGSAATDATSVGLGASASLFSAPGLSRAQGFAERDFNFTALSTGLLTISIPYRLELQGQISGGALTGGISDAFLTIGGHGSFVDDRDTLRTFLTDHALHTVNETRSGVLSVSSYFTKDEFGQFAANVTGQASVPVPDTFWPFGIGFVLLGLLYWQMRRTAHAS